MEHIHFIGIGGTGLSAIATVLLEQGYTVSGSDLTESNLYEAVQKSGGTVTLGHLAEILLVQIWLSDLQQFQRIM